MKNVLKHYEFLGTTTKEHFCIRGVELFSYNWQTIGDVAIVLHPKTKKPYTFSAYKITVGEKTLKFVAGKYDDDHWGFYTYD